MKKLLIIIAISLTISCNKKTCWECQVRQMNGATKTERVCNDGETPQFTDANGNDLNSVCQKK